MTRSVSSPFTHMLYMNFVSKKNSLDIDTLFMHSKKAVERKSRNVHLMKQLTSEGIEINWKTNLQYLDFLMTSNWGIDYIMWM